MKNFKYEGYFTENEQSWKYYQLINNFGRNNEFLFALYLRYLLNF